MKADLKAKWVEALRSGKFQQGRIHFKLGDKFCCLGVLCRVAGERTTLGPYADNWDFVETAISQHGIVGQLIQMNDGIGNYDRRSFPEIADFIEAEVLTDHSVTEPT